MKLAPETPLAASLAFEEDKTALPAGRLAMAAGLAQLEWSPDVIAADLPESACPAGLQIHRPPPMQRRPVAPS